MKQKIGFIKALYRYPVKSMAGEELASISLDWHGVEGDRRFAFRRVEDKSNFPWLTAGKLRSMICYQPLSANDTDGSSSLPTHVRTPEGKELEMRGDALRLELSAEHKAEVELMHLKHGVFDETPLSLISTSTLNTIGKEIGKELDVRRFRPNILVQTISDAPFPENEWVGKIVVFGDSDDDPAMNVMMKDVRCSMINLDPNTAESSPETLKAVARINKSCAGVYGAVFRTGTISAGTPIYLIDAKQYKAL